MVNHLNIKYRLPIHNWFTSYLNVYLSCYVKNSYIVYLVKHEWNMIYTCNKSRNTSPPQFNKMTWDPKCFCICSSSEGSLFIYPTMAFDSEVMLSFPGMIPAYKGSGQLSSLLKLDREELNNFEITYTWNPCLKPVYSIWIFTLQPVSWRDVCQQANYVGLKIMAHSGIKPASFASQSWRFPEWANSVDM